ncbi:RND transporter [Thiomicrospira aerophila AL3]|uniref:RND transporter n=1 Tax=Thiomicrospira aerophila AL3 TaxID=717772 RepID=W0DY67_9GAMM|nr:efflux RND transporter periplasmic adaptor subunit [Thiomicrospira aerophila]AHF01934.1 RND transporter [Thiomicrospira aerophila AL3]
MRWVIMLGFLLVNPLAMSAIHAQSDEAWRAQIQTQPLSEVVIERSQSFAAEVISPNKTQLASELNARVLRIYTRPGQRVQQGQPLVELDCQDTQLQAERLIAQRQQNQASLSLAQSTQTRLAQLQNRDLAALSQLDEVAAQVQQLQAQGDILAVEQRLNARQIERCTIKAPFTGSVLTHHVGEGQWVNVGHPLLELLQTEQAEISTQLPFSWLQSLDHTRPADLNARLQVRGLDDLDLQLIRQAPHIDPNSRTVQVWFNAPTDLPIGLSGQVRLTHPQPFLPAQVIVQRGQAFGVFTLEDNQLRFRQLQGVQEGRPHTLPADWPDNLLIVTQGQQRLTREQAND